MGKASREKRERRDEASTLPKIDVPAERRSLPVFWIVIALVVVAGIVALVVTQPDDSTKAREDAAKDIPAYADVKVDGAKLPEWDGQGTDDGIGEAVPTIAGTGMDGKPLTLRPGGGTPAVYITMAHWCPHCQAEIPRIIEWAGKDGNLPEGVDIHGISTSVDKSQNNYPPAAWLAREDWPFDTLIDDELGTAAEAMGVSGFPYMVFVDADGNVVKRFSGEMPIDDFESAVQEIAKTAPATDGATTSGAASGAGGAQG